MGQSLNKKEPILEKHIVATVRKRFQEAAQGSRRMDRTCFKAMSSHFLSPKLFDILFELLKTNEHGVEALSEDCFLLIAELALGGYETQAEGIFLCDKSLQEIVESIVTTFFKCEECETNSSVRDLLVKHILANSPHNKSSIESISQWLASVNTFPTIMRRISRKLCLGYYKKILPELKCTTVLTPAALAVITLHLPYERRHDWTLLYSSDQHGMSFMQLVLKVDGTGPCLVVIESQSGRVFGGFASEGFQRGPHYKGDHCCFLFEDRTILNIYHATGYDTRFAYMYGARSHLRGIGMGGSLTNWSFFVGEDLEEGISTPNISTFEKCWLAGEEIFTLKSIEIWRIGPPRERNRYDSDRSEIIWDNRSVLDRDPGALAILELCGKKADSEAAHPLKSPFI